MKEFKIRMKVSDLDPGFPASISGAMSARCASRISLSFGSAAGSAQRSLAGPVVAIEDAVGGAAVAHIIGSAAGSLDHDQAPLGNVRPTEDQTCGM
jgi:hypothetical protein